MKKILFLISQFFLIYFPLCSQSLHSDTINKELKIVVISDLNGSYGSTTYDADVHYVINEIKRLKPDLVLCGGDMVAGQDASFAEEDLTAMWSGFRSSILKPITKLHIPFGFTVGNHDASPYFPLDRKIAQNFWSDKKSNPTLLTFVDSTFYPFYFSYVKNNVFFISWDAAGALVPEAVQRWMAGQLASPIAQHARMRIVLGHLPLFPIVEKTNVSGEYIGNISLDFFKSQHVSLYISGHQHAYYPAYKNGLELLNAGCIGSGQRQYLNSSAEAEKAYTLLTIPVEKPEGFSYETYNPQTYQIILMNTLPMSITGLAGTIQRRDQHTND